MMPDSSRNSIATSPDETPSRRMLWIVRAILAAVLIGLVLFLRETDSPWKKGLESLADPERARTKHFVTSGLWWAAVINTALTALLLATVQWWLRVRTRTQQIAASVSDHAKGTLRFVLPLAGAILVAAILGAPRLNLSLWGDEEHTLREYMLGEFERNEDGELVERLNSWQRTLWAYSNPNNHILNTVLARISLSTWRTFVWDGSGLPFSEAAMRLPGFFAALGGLAAIAALLRAMSFTRAGVIAAWICALHPWYLRYATESRGYAFMLLLLPLALLCLVKLWRDPRWSTALGLGLTEFLLLWAYPGALYALVFANAAFLVALIARAYCTRTSWRGRIEDLLPAGRRWLIGSLVGGMIFAQLYGPCAPQLVRYLSGQRAQEGGTIDVGWLRDLGGLMLYGTRWSFPDPSNTIAVTLSGILAERPWLWIVVALFAVALVVGLIRILRAGGIATALGIACCLALAFTFVHAQLSKNYLYHWYVIFALPAVIIFMALGLEQVGGWFIRRRWHLTGYIAPAIGLLLFGILTSPQRHVLRTHAIEQQRESVLFTRPAMGIQRAEIESILTFGLAKGGSHFMTVPSYDIGSYYVSSADELRELMSRADATGTPLFANIALPALGRIVYPEVMAVLDDPQVFSLVKILQGLEDHVTRYVYRYSPGAGSQHETPQAQP